MLGGKKFVYSLRITADLDEHEIQVLNKYGYFAEKFIIDPEISARISVDKETKGPHELSISQLQKSVEWSCDHLPLYFSNIPVALTNRMEERLGMAYARENWNGDDTLNIPEENEQ